MARPPQRRGGGRRLAAGPRASVGRLTVRLEDTDPYRDCHQWPAAPRLADADVAGWQERFAAAWALIESEYPAYAAGLAQVCPRSCHCQAGPAGQEISASARQAFGAVGAALPADGENLALLLIHEFQHVKLGAMLDMFDLYDRCDGRLFYAPWREDPRPVEALLQGTYAHLGVTDYWRARGIRLTAQTHSRRPSVSPAGGRLPRRRSRGWPTRAR